MSTATINSASKPSINRSILGSIVGGVIFGMMMSMMSMIKNVAMLIDSNSLAVGWALHMTISIIFGIFYFAILTILNIKMPAALKGLIYGVGLWTVGYLWLMPAKLDMPIFHIDNMAMKSLMGHMIFGAILGMIAKPKKIS